MGVEDLVAALRRKQLGGREALVAHRVAVASARCCAAARPRKIRRLTTRSHRIGLCAAREVWRSYARAPNTFVRIDTRCRAHGEAVLHASSYVPTGVKTARALADRQERWRRARNWERRRAALLATARAAAALTPLPTPQPLCRGMVRLYRGMAREVLRQVFAYL